MTYELERGERVMPDRPNVSDYVEPMARWRRRDVPVAEAAQDWIPPGLELTMLVWCALPLACADVFTAFWLRRR